MKARTAVARKPPREFVIYTDESEKDGKYFSNFYGGLLVRSTDLRDAIERLEACKLRLNLFGEVKWQKVTANYLGKYIELMGEFFDLVANDKVKVRIMFTHNRFVPTGLTPEQRRIEYYLLYYQLLKHAFGLPYSNPGPEPVYVRLNLDQLPNNREQNALFKAGRLVESVESLVPPLEADPAEPRNRRGEVKAKKMTPRSLCLAA